MNKVARIILLALVLAVVGCETELAEKSACNQVRLDTQSPVITAGDSLKVTIIQNSDCTDELFLVWTSPDNMFVISNDSLQTKYNNILPSCLTQKSGHAEIMVTTASRVLTRDSVLVVPGPPEGIITAYTGPKTILSEKKENAMAIMVPTDIYTNPVGEGTEIIYTIKYENRPTLSFNSPVHNMFAIETFDAGSSIGRIMVGGKSGEAVSNEQEVIAIAGTPSSITLNIEEYFPYSDPARYLKMTTTPMVDKVGHIVADGTFCQFLTYRNNTVHSIHSGKTVNGIATVYIQNPEMPGELSIRAYSGNVSSDILTLGFDRFVRSIKIRYDANSQCIIIDPVIGILGQTVSDGTNVMIEYRINKSKYKSIIQTDNGMAILKIPYHQYVRGKMDVFVTCGGLQQNDQFTLQ